MAGRKLLLILIVLLCLILAGIVWWAQGGKKLFRKEISSLLPEVKITALYISDIDDRKMTIVGDAIVKNKLPAELVIDSLDYDLYIDSTHVLHSNHIKEISIAGGGSEKVRIPMQVDIKKLRELIKKFENQQRDSALYTLKGDYKIKIPVAGLRKIKINESKMAPALRDIHVTAGKMKFDKMGLKNTAMSMTVKVENHNAFPVKMKDGRYNIEIGDNINLHGGMQKIVDIPAKGSETIDIHIDTKTIKLPKLGWKWLFREHRTRYRMNFSCIVMSDSEIMRRSTLNIRDEGTLDQLRQLTKKLKD